MLKRNIITAVLLFLLALCPAFSAKEGQKAPSIIMKASNGDVFNPAKEKKKVLLLSFFSHNCVPCMNEIPELQALAGDGCDIYLVAETSTGEGEAADFFAKIKNTSGIEVTLPVVYDTYGDMMKKFDVKSYPVVMLIDKKGKIRLRIDGYRPENIEQLGREIK